MSGPRHCRLFQGILCRFTVLPWKLPLPLLSVHRFEIAGDPGPNRTFILNGDFVDRGAWGLEVVMLFCCWKLGLPQNVFMIRGNHETALLTVLYGFKEEIKAKYGKKQWNSVHVACKKLFASLPLAARVNQQTLVLHGGLFRKQKTRSKRKHNQTDVLGDLNDLRKAPKGGLDPSGLGTSRLATDVLWSDPSNNSGFVENDSRGVGMIFGPEITEVRNYVAGISGCAGALQFASMNVSKERLPPHLTNPSLRLHAAIP